MLVANYVLYQSQDKVRPLFDLVLYPIRACWEWVAHGFGSLVIDSEALFDSINNGAASVNDGKLVASWWSSS